jgi:hypothetical protein
VGVLSCEKWDKSIVSSQGSSGRTKSADGGAKRRLTGGEGRRQLALLLGVKRILTGGFMPFYSW